MFKRLKLLTLLQLSDRLKVKKIENSKQVAARIAIGALLVAVLTGIMCLLLFAICDVMVVPKNEDIVVFFISIFQVLSVIACTNGLLKTLYTGKDNAILLSYPARHVEVFISKLLVYYISEFVKSIFMLLPLFLSVGIMFNNFTFIYIISSIFMIVVLPLFPVLIGALITIPLMYFNRLLLKVPFLKTLGAIGLLVLLFYIIVWIVELIPVPFRLVALYGEFMDKFVVFLKSFNEYALYYNSIGLMMFGKDAFINFLIVLGVLVGLIVLIVLISMPLYFSLASKSSEQANTKKHRGGNITHKNTFFTFVKKEWLLSTRNFSDFINNYSFLIALPYVAYLATSIMLAIYRNELGNFLTVGVLGCIPLILASASNTSSAMAITQEGSEFVLLKTVPANTMNMCWAKIFFNMIFSTAMIVISFVVVQIFCTRFCDRPDIPEYMKNVIVMIPAKDLWLTCLCVVIINVGLILWSFQLDINNPNLREYASNGDSSNNKNISQSIKIGLIVTLIFTVLLVLFLWGEGNGMFTWAKIIGICVAFLALRFYFFRNYLKYVFPRIEY